MQHNKSLFQKLDSSSLDSDSLGDDRFALDDYESENEDQTSHAAGSNRHDGLSASTLALLDRFKGQFSSRPAETQEPEDEEVKIFYCSRTHSQLKQFSDELRRVNVPSSIPNDLDMLDNGDNMELEERVKHLSLGSRKNLCINPKVTALENSTAINERCLELQQPGVSAQMKCPYLPSKEDEALTLQFRDHALATVKDIEDIGKVGKHLGICPYYASRPVIKHSEVRNLIVYNPLV